MDLQNETVETGPSTSEETDRKRRKGIDYHKSTSQKGEIDSNPSDHDFSPDGTEDEYELPPKKPTPTKKTTYRPRGINAHRAAVNRQQNWTIETLTPEPERNTIRGRGRPRGRGRGSRSILLSEHRQLVEALQQEEGERETNSANRSVRSTSNTKLPVLSAGKYLIETLNSIFRYSDLNQ